MMISSCATPISANRLLPFSSSLSAAGPSSRCVTNFPKSLRSPSMKCADFTILKREVPCSPEPKRKCYVQAHSGVWEDPDDGSDYDDEVEEMDEEEEEDDDDSDFESDWEAGASVSVASDNSSKEDTYEEDLIKEVEQLLGPEEKAILEENNIPNLGKIATAKWSPLHTLALSLQMRCMDRLLENGLDVDFVDKEGLTALHKAVIGKKEAVISHLLRKGADPHVRDRDGATPLHYAVQVSALQTVKLLIKYNVDVSAADNDGWTPLHIAMQSRNRDIAKVLLVNGADKTLKTKNGKTALDLSLCYGKEFKSYDLAKLLKLVPANSGY